MISYSVIKKIAYVYLFIPIAIFGIGWLDTGAALVFTLFIAGALAAVWKKEQSRDVISAGKWGWIITGLIIILWVYLSGIGGFAFQNWDHHSRNAVFHDLIRYDWPVVYHLEDGVATQFDAPQSVLLSYYFGFWLPSALVGKIAGLEAGNLFLFFWAIGGIMLTIILTGRTTKLSLIKTSLLIIFFSGMDIVGAWLFQWIPNYDYPSLWPPIQHLEWWAGSLQYSSFTTGLYWTYNQFVPAILVLSLFAVSEKADDAVLLLGICFFFAPIPALGLLPFVAFKFLTQLISSGAENEVDRDMKFSRTVITLENITGLVIAGVALLFYSTNLSAQSRTIQLSAPVVIYLIFIFLEGLLFWLLLLPVNRKNWMWYISGFILIIAPFIKVGASWDFVMRTSLPSLYILMMGCGLFLAENRASKIRPLLVLLLALGALTPLYEISRSLVRTDRYFGYLLFSTDYFEEYFQDPPQTNQAFIPEADHLNSLSADDWISVSIPNKAGWDTKVGSLFEPSFGVLWKEELIQK